MLYQKYYQKALERMALVMRDQAENIERAADMFTRCISQDGIIYVFGCGHSHMMSEEMFYRAGGLACVSAILVDDLMLHRNAARSSLMEQQENLTPPLAEEFGMTKNDLLLVISTSGVNPAPIDMVLSAQALGVPVLGISSSEYAQQPPRHSSGKRLFETVDLFLDNHAPLGDACVKPEDCAKATGPLSTILSVLLINCIVVQAVENLSLLGSDVPVYQSGNVADGGKANRELIERYRSRVKLLEPVIS